MRVLSGHTRDVRAVAFAPDGRLVSGGGDRTVRVWNVATGEGVVIAKATGPVYAVAVSPDGTTIAYAGRHRPQAESNFVYLRDLDGKSLGSRELRFEAERFVQNPATGGFGYVLEPDPRSVWSLAFSTDGEYLAAVTRRMGGANIPDGGGGRVWARGKTEGYSLSPDAYAVAFASSGLGLAVARRYTIAFHDTPSSPQGTSYPLPAMWAPAVAFVPGADLAVVASNSFLYFVNPVKAGKPARVKTGSRAVVALAAAPDGRSILAGGRKGSVEVYDSATRIRTATYDFGVGGIQALAFAPDGLTFAAAGDAGLVVCDAGG